MCEHDNHRLGLDNFPALEALGPIGQVLFMVLHGCATLSPKIELNPTATHVGNNPEVT